MSWFLGGYKKYADFSGRATRQEFWFFTFFFLIAFALLLTAEITIATATPFDTYTTLVGLYMLASIFPILAVTVRRLHDTDRSGWWYLLNFIPFGSIVLIVFLCLDSSPGQNRFGANPKLEPASE